MAPASVSTSVFRRTGLPGELLGDHRQRRAGGLAHPEREVARLPAHRDDEVPARRRLRIHHQVLDDLDAVVPRRLEAERVHVVRQVEIVVDRLRHVDDADAALGLLFELHRRVGGVVAADRDQLRDVQPQQRDDRLLEVLGVERRVRPRDADVRSAAEVDAADALRSSDGSCARCCPASATRTRRGCRRPRRLRARTGWWRR